MNILRSVYNISPEFVKKVYRKLKSKVVPFPYIMGKEFAQTYNELMESQWYSKEQLEELQLKKLEAIIKHAYENVPYYRKIFDERGLKPKDIQNFGDLKKLPILTKGDVRNNFRDIISRNYMEFNPTLNHTSGSTGEPLSYYIDDYLSTLISACVQRHWRWCGIEPKDLIAVFRGTLIDEFGKERSSYWKLKGDQLHFSTFEMTDEVMTEYVEQLNKWKPALIRGYPSSLEILAQFINEQNLEVSSPKAIHTSSEMVLQEQRELIEKAFEALLFDWYGHGESTINAGECDKHEGLHLSLEFGYTEFIKTTETENMENIYNVVSTSLHNYSMPFIRYDTEDLTLLEHERCSCGRVLPLIKKIVCRRGDIIKGINGVKIGPPALVHFWKYKVAENLSNISYAQIVQKAESVIQVRLAGEKVQKNEEVITKQLRLLLGDIQVKYEYLPQIPSGQKWRFTVSEICESLA